MNKLESRKLEWKLVFQTHLINEERSVVEDVLHRLSPADDPSTKHSLKIRKVRITLKLIGITQDKTK